MSIQPESSSPETPQQRHDERIRRATELREMTIRMAWAQFDAAVDAAEIAYAREALEHDHDAGGQS